MGKFKIKSYRGKYAAIWYENGEVKRRSLRTDDPVAAQLAFVRFTKAVEENSRATAPAKLIKTILQEYWDAKPGIEPRPALSFFGDLIPQALTKQHGKDYVKKRLNQGVAPSTIHGELSKLKTAIKFAGYEAPKFEMPDPGPPRERWLTSEELHKLIEGAGMPHVRLFIFMGIFTAARKEAILTLPWSRVTETYIDFNDPDRKKTKKRRAIVPIVPELKKELKEARNIAITENVIECYGKPIKNIRKAFERAAERAGIKDVSPHTLRHTAATWMAKRKVPLHEIQVFLGHKGQSTTERVYIKHSPNYLSKAIKALSAEFRAGFKVALPRSTEQVDSNRIGEKRRKTRQKAIDRPQKSAKNKKASVFTR